MNDLLTTLTHAIEGTPAVALIAAVAWGILSILLSPCHLASIPLIVGFIDKQGRMTARRSAMISGLFAGGILLTILVIGAITAAAGRMLGNVGAWANYFVAAIFFLVGLYLLDVIPMPFGGPGQVAMKRKGALAALVLGMVFGIALGPCTFAYMAPMLGVTFKVGASSVLYGVLLLLAYGVGHCSVIVAAGTSTGMVQRYLNWTERSRGTVIVRRACGVLVLFGGLYLIYVAPMKLSKVSMNAVAENIPAATSAVAEPAASGGIAGAAQPSTSRYLLIGVALLAVWWLIYRGLQPLSVWITYSLLCLPHYKHFSAAVEFFLFEVPKVLMLLTIVVFGVGMIRTFFTPQRTRRILAGRRESAGNVLAALLGVVTPFCSCSAVPLFIGFVTAGVPLGVTFSFLISAPMVNEVALVLLAGMFGWKVAGIYVGTGLLIAIIAGWIIGRLKMEKHVEAWVYKTQVGEGAAEETLDFPARIRQGIDAVRDIVGRVWLYVVLGIAVGAGIHGYVPTNALAGMMGKSAWWSVPLSVLIGVPMYSNAAGIIPIVKALLEKGAALGTVLAFMMSVIGLSLPETIILRKVLRPRLIGVFVGVVAVGILIVGYLFNLLM